MIQTYTTTFDERTPREDNHELTSHKRLHFPSCLTCSWTTLRVVGQNFPNRNSVAATAHACALSPCAVLTNRRVSTAHSACARTRGVLLTYPVCTAHVPGVYCSRTQCVLHTYPVCTAHIPGVYCSRTQCVLLTYPVCTAHVPGVYYSRTRCVLLYSHTRCVLHTYPVCTAHVPGVYCSRTRCLLLYSHTRCVLLDGAAGEPSARVAVESTVAVGAATFVVWPGVNLPQGKTLATHREIFQTQCLRTHSSLKNTGTARS